MTVYSIKFNDISSEEIGLSVTKRPYVPAPAENITEIQVPGRNGTLHVSDHTYPDISFTIEFGFMNNDYWDIWQKAKKWLRGTGNLVLSDNEEYFLKVNNIVIDNGSRELKRIGKFTATISSAPFFYSFAGQQKILNPSKLYNDGCVSHPVYYITGEGMCSLEVNDITVTANVGQNVTIDTDKQIAYRTDGTMVNASITGDYSDLWLKEGDNSISITAGFTLYVKPEWGYL